MAFELSWIAFFGKKSHFGKTMYIFTDNRTQKNLSALDQIKKFNAEGLQNITRASFSNYSGSEIL